MQLGHAMHDTEARADILGATYGEPLPPPWAAVAQEERRSVVGPCRQVPLDLVSSVPGDHRGALDVTLTANDHALPVPVAAIQLQRLRDTAARRDE